MLASGRDGREPIMFNGGVLTFDPIFAKSRHKGPGYTPDHRQWGSALTAQNQRCMYWPMLKTGDFDLMIPGFDFYRDGLNNARRRVRHYWDHDGCAFTEQTTIQALPGAMVYGYQGEKYKGKTWRYRPDSIEPGVQVNGACNYLYESQLEWSWMILQYHQFTGEDISPYLPLIEQSVIFYDEHYRMREETTHRQAAHRRRPAPHQAVEHPGRPSRRRQPDQRDRRAAADPDPARRVAGDLHLAGEEEALAGDARPPAGDADRRGRWPDRAATHRGSRQPQLAHAGDVSPRIPTRSFSSGGPAWS